MEILKRESLIPWEDGQYGVYISSKRIRYELRKELQFMMRWGMGNEVGVLWEFLHVDMWV